MPNSALYGEQETNSNTAVVSLVINVIIPG